MNSLIEKPQMLLKCAIPFLTTSWKRAGYNNLTQAFYNRQKREQASMQRMFRYFWGEQEPVTGAIGVGLLFVVPMPKSWSLKKKIASCGQRCTVKPDIDNLTKFLLDAMNGIIYRDDRQCFLSNRGAAKFWGNHGRTFIWLENYSKVLNVEEIELTFSENERRQLSDYDSLGLQNDEELCEENLP